MLTIFTIRARTRPVSPARSSVTNGAVARPIGSKEEIMAHRVQIYTTRYCPYCVRAKSLLAQRAIAFEEIDVTGDDEARARLVTVTGGWRTVPQIFIDGVPIGGCDELYELDRRGQLLFLFGRAPEGGHAA